MADDEDNVIIFWEVARAGIDIYQEVQRKIFSLDCVTAELLRNRCVEFVVAFLVSSRFIEGYLDIAENIRLVVIEFQKLITRLEELFNNVTEDGVSYNCPTEMADTTTQGRPKLLIPQEQLEGLRSLGFSWVAISKMLGVSERTVRRRKEEYNMSSTDLFSEISDSEIDELMKYILRISPSSGERMIIGWFRGRGIRVQRWRLRESIARVDPISRDLRRRTVTARRAYSVPTPNSLWHLDGHHKLIRWRIVIHGAIDGYSRAVVFLHASTNNTASTVLDRFKGAIQVFHYLRRIRTDYGTENIAVAREMLIKYGVESKPVITGQSVHNQRIERLWRDVHNYIVLYFKNIFYYLESTNLLDPNNESDLFALHYVFIPMINRAIDQFVLQWNNHPISKQCGCSPLQLWTEGFYKFAQSDYSTVREVLDPKDVTSDYGLDDDAPLPELQTANHLEIPESEIDLTQSELSALFNVINPTLNDNEHGIDSYKKARTTLNEIMSNR